MGTDPGGEGEGSAPNQGGPTEQKPEKMLDPVEVLRDGLETLRDYGLAWVRTFLKAQQSECGFFEIHADWIMALHRLLNTDVTVFEILDDDAKTGEAEERLVRIGKKQRLRFHSHPYAQALFHRLLVTLLHELRHQVAGGTGLWPRIRDWLSGDPEDPAAHQPVPEHGISSGSDRLGREG